MPGRRAAGPGSGWSGLADRLPATPVRGEAPTRGPRSRLAASAAGCCSRRAVDAFDAGLRQRRRPTTCDASRRGRGTYRGYGHHPRPRGGFTVADDLRVCVPPYVQSGSDRPTSADSVDPETALFLATPDVLEGTRDAAASLGGARPPPLRWPYSVSSAPRGSPTNGNRSRLYVWSPSALDPFQPSGLGTPTSARSTPSPPLDLAPRARGRRTPVLGAPPALPRSRPVRAPASLP